MAAPEKEVICFVGDGSYMMANSELVTAAMLNVPFTVVLTDNRGYGCINRLQQECGGAEFNNMYKDSLRETLPEIDFVAHARAMGAEAIKVSGIAGLEAELARKPARKGPRDSRRSTPKRRRAQASAAAGGMWRFPRSATPKNCEPRGNATTNSASLQRAYRLTPRPPTE